MNLLVFCHCLADRQAGEALRSRPLISKGFTLVELLVVISIISLLSSIVFTSVNSARSKARYARALTDMKQIAVAAEFDYDTRGDYAPDTGAGSPAPFVPTYLSVWPTPPCNDWGYDWDNWLA